MTPAWHDLSCREADDFITRSLLRRRSVQKGYTSRSCRNRHVQCRRAARRCNVPMVMLAVKGFFEAVKRFRTLSYCRYLSFSL